MSEQKTDFKIVILARYCGEFQPADEQTANVKKTSEQIVMDIRPMADFSTNEIAAYLATNGYQIGFEDSTPVWLMNNKNSNELHEH